MNGRHFRRDCKVRVKCDKCSGDHITRMHTIRDQNLQRSHRPNQPSVESAVAHQHVGRKETPVALNIVPLRLIGPEGQQWVNCLLDSGANFSVLAEGTSEAIGLQGQYSPLEVIAMGGKSQSFRTKRCTVRVQAGQACFSVRLHTMPVVTRAVPVHDWSKLKQRYQHLQHLPLSKPITDRGGRHAYRERPRTFAEVSARGRGKIRRTHR